MTGKPLQLAENLVYALKKNTVKKNGKTFQKLLRSYNPLYILLKITCVLLIAKCIN
jgi:hypothetical protein